MSESNTVEESDKEWHESSNDYWDDIISKIGIEEALEQLRRGHRQYRLDRIHDLLRNKIVRTMYSTRKLSVSIKPEKYLDKYLKVLFTINMIEDTCDGKVLTYADKSFRERVHEQEYLMEGYVNKKNS